MLKNLVIVESPAKAKTIEKFLGSDYKVMSSYGHIRDLCKKNFSIEVDNDYKPVYEIPEDKKTLVSELKKAAANAQTVWLASDEDREGEAIAWHLYEVLGLKADRTRRIVFHEITKSAILNAIAHPRGIDLNLVDAQQARRVLDRIVGFELSPVLWKKIKPSLSAGRVQSVAVRLIVDREEEIKKFKAEPYMRVTGHFTTAGGQTFRAELSRRLPEVDAARRFLEDCSGADVRYEVSDVQVKPLRKSPAPPFTTSTLQQEASRKLGFTVSQTMMVAQRLYEAGHITYMRTDSLNLSSLAIDSISREIADTIGPKYLKVRHYHTSSKGAQEAHEAIRPTYMDRHAIDGTSQEKRLYNLIWKRTIASQMADAEIEKTTVDIAISARPESFTASGEVIKFDGFLNVYIEGHDDESAETAPEGILPRLEKGDTLSCGDITAAERFTQQPPRYTEASLVKKLEELGIGRPSTYAPTISTIQQREYVEKGERAGVERTVVTLLLKDGKITEKDHTETFGAEKGKLIPTDIGVIVNRFLTEYFPRILDYNFTAQVEGKFDRIAEGELKWTNEINSFYHGFHPDVESAMNMRLEHKVGERLLGTDPESGKPVSVKIGRFGPLVQIGTNDGDTKPRFASLQKGQSLETITLEEALRLFSCSRQLGDYEGKAVSVGVGRFGPYVRHDGKYISVPDSLDCVSITLPEAVELIESKRAEERNKIVKTFADAPEVRILNGRYGVYISADGTNYKIPKSVTDPSALTLEDCRAIMAQQEQKPKRAPRRGARKKQ
ncbi:MAG: type I DNA topoisomerase [Bacteroidales bacterium]|nr:type I DNA topoisomerase [Bacteroidales bacterium]